VQKALIDLIQLVIYVRKELNLLSVLMSLKLVVNAICCKAANPITADAAIKFTMESLGKEISERARELQMEFKLCFSKRRTIYTGFWWGNLREKDHLEDPGVDRRIILRLIFRKWKMGAWTG